MSLKWLTDTELLLMSIECSTFCRPRPEDVHDHFEKAVNRFWELVRENPTLSSTFLHPWDDQAFSGLMIRVDELDHGIRLVVEFDGIGGSTAFKMSSDQA